MTYLLPDPLRLHPATHELIQRDYLLLKESYPMCTPIQQIHNTIMHFAPDLYAAIASIQQATKRLLADMRTYPADAEKLTKFLPYASEFCERVQETSAKLHNGEPARQAAIEALDKLMAESKQREEERRQQWLVEVVAGDAYFGGPGAYQRIRDEYFAELDMKKREALRQRIRTFQYAYRQSEQPPVQPEPVQAGLWQEVLV